MASGLPGLAVASIAAGGVLVVSGLKGATISDTLRSLIKGEPVSPDEAQALMTDEELIAAGGKRLSSGSRAGALGEKVAADASSYQGVKYVWAGETPAGWDCSGFVTWVLHHDNGIDLPSNLHTTAAGFHVWSGARTIPRGSCAPGDLVSWVSHIGIAIGNTEMIHAPGVGQQTKVARIWGTPAPTIRRPLAYGGV